MNMHYDRTTLDAAIDRLVDGELGEAERRELFARLENEPNGWRRCALAFLEAQCWKEALENLSEAARQTSPATIRFHPPKGHFRREQLVRVLSLAACFLAALLLGAWLRQLLGPVGSLGPNAQFAKLGSTGEKMLPPEGLADKTSPRGVWRLVSLAPTSGTSGQAVNVPALESEQLDERWLQNLPPPIPEKVLQALNRTGHRVRQRRELVPLPLEDGRQLVLPVDHVELYYVGNGGY